MNLKDKVQALEPQVVAASESPDLKLIFRKIKTEAELTVPEVEALLYAVECDNPSLFTILCGVHAVLEKGTQADIDSLAATIRHWEKDNVKIDY